MSKTLNKNTDQAPKDGTKIIASFRNSPEFVAMWSDREKQWVTAEPREQGGDRWFETEWYDHSDMTGWREF